MCRWSASADGNGARRKAISDVATRVAMQLGGTHVSSSWRSYRDYLVALRKLADADTPEQAEPALVEAQALLQRSLDYDAANLLARFNLATVLRKRGKNEEAAEQFAYVERLASDANALPEPARSFVGRHPELLLVAQYNRAVALSKIESWDAHSQAVRLLEQLGQSPTTNGADDGRSLNLTMLSRSALAAALVFRLAHRTSEARGDPERRSRFRQRVLEDVEAQRDWVARLPAASADLNWQAYSHALATVDNAYGRACFEHGRYEQAMSACQSSVALRPDFGDAYVTLAAVLLKQTSRHPNWQRRANEYIERALAISPFDERALFLKGDLASHPAVGDYAGAKEAYARIVDNPWAFFRHAELLEREGDLAGAAKELIKSLHVSESPDVRGERFLEIVVKLAARGQANARLRQEGERVGRILQKTKDERLRTSAARLIDILARTPPSATAAAEA